MFKKIPHTYVIIFMIIVLAAVLTWLIPGGQYEREIVISEGVEREIIVSDSFQYTDNDPQTWQIFSAFFDGFVNAANIIAFILMIGGAFWIMNESKAIDAGIYSFLNFSKKTEKYRMVRAIGSDNIIIVLIMLMFSLFGAVFGMSEETIAFIIIFVPLAIKMGYDSITGVAMCFVGAGLGFAGAILNPFTIGIAQGLSQIPLFSGIEYRLFCWVVINIIGISYVLWYAAKIRRNPKGSIVYDDDAYWRAKNENTETSISEKSGVAGWVVYGFILAVLISASVLYPVTTLTVGNSSVTFSVLPIIAALFAFSGIFSLLKNIQYFILTILGFTILFLIIGVMGYGWYVKEIATLFLFMGLASGAAMNYHANKITTLFITGAADILSAALVVGLAAGIIVILEDGNIIDTLLYSISNSMSEMGRIGSVGMMYIFQTILNTVIPSGSGKAALTMPMMSQFSDLIGVSRQATVMAFQFGDGFTNMIIPTSGVLIGVLGVAKIPYEKWVKWITPLMIILLITGFLLLIPTVTMDLSGF